MSRATRTRCVFSCVYVLVFVGVLGILDGLGFPIEKDETRYWPTTVLFADEWPPSLALLRDYPELNTPLPFIVFGTLEHFFGGGIAVGRGLNLACALGMILLIVWAGREARRAGLCAGGLILFPYFLGVSAHLYTDPMATLFVLLGVHWHLRGHPWRAAVSLALAIACRQYMVAFPLALALAAIRRRERVSELWAPVLSAGTVLLWFLFFGGFAPSSEVARQGIATPALAIRPSHALYALACVGAYFVVGEAVLLGRWRLFSSVLSRKGAWLASLVGVAILLFPPLENRDYSIPTQGYLDRGVRLIVGELDLLRMGIFAGLVFSTVWRFRQGGVATLLIATNALMLSKAHIAWDKYALPLLAVLWYLAARADELDRVRPGEISSSASSS